MALWNNFPYSDYHELNLDWIIDEMKKIIPLPLDQRYDKSEMDYIIEKIENYV